jgi:ATP-dependent DNA ligase
LLVGADDLRGLTLVERRALLREHLKHTGAAIIYSEHMEGADGEAMFRHACGLGLEGIVSKRATSRYRSGRCAAWVKVNIWNSFPLGRSLVVFGLARFNSSRTPGGRNISVFLLTTGLRAKEEQQFMPFEGEHELHRPRRTISALVDEATGYQKERAADALARILEAFIAKELQPWIKTMFPQFRVAHVARKPSSLRRDHPSAARISRG